MTLDAFILRRPQLAAMARRAQEAFVDKMLPYAIETYPEWYDAHPGPAARAFIADAMQQAMSLGISVEGDVALYVEVTLVHGLDFAEREENDWLKAILEDPKLPGDGKASFAHEELVVKQREQAAWDSEFGEEFGR